MPCNGVIECRTGFKGEPLTSQTDVCDFATLEKTGERSEKLYASKVVGCLNKSLSGGTLCVADASLRIIRTGF